MTTLSMAKRRLFLDNAEFIRRLHAAGQERRANLLHKNRAADAERMMGELLHKGALMSHSKRAELHQRIAELQQRATELGSSDAGGSYGGPLKKKKSHAASGKKA